MPKTNRVRYVVMVGVLLVLTISVLPMYTRHAAAQVQPQSVLTMNDAETATIHPNGDASVREVISMSASYYAALKQQYPTLSGLTRIFNPAYNTAQYENLQVVENDQNNSVVATYTIQGASVNKGDNQWSFVVPNTEGVPLTLASQTAGTLVFTYATSVSADLQETSSLTIHFPSQTSNIKFDSASNSVTYTLPAPSQASGGNSVFLVGGVLIVVGIAILFVGVRSHKKELPPPPTVS